MLHRRLLRNDPGGVLGGLHGLLLMLTGLHPFRAYGWRTWLLEPDFIHVVVGWLGSRALSHAMCFQGLPATLVT
jgi:hypothetical protein